MPTWGWAGAILIIACAIFLGWRLVQMTKQPRRFFRGGLADPQRERFAPSERGTLAPQTVEDTGNLRAVESTLDEEAASLIEGERHHATPITTNIDREAEGAIAGDQDAETRDPDEVIHRGSDATEWTPAAEAERRRAERERSRWHGKRSSPRHGEREGPPVEPGAEPGDGTTSPMPREERNGGGSPPP